MIRFIASRVKKILQIQPSHGSAAADRVSGDHSYVVI